MNIIPFTTEHLSMATDLFIDRSHPLHASVPSLPDAEEKKSQLMSKLERLIKLNGGVAATNGGKLVGYLTWVIDDHLRVPNRRGAYCPEWAHAASREKADEIYLALYREAAQQWSNAGCTSHAFTYLVNDQAAEKFLYWNGFGLICVDAIRPMHLNENTQKTQHEIRKANKNDAALIARLDKEHWRHYAQPPIFMAANHPSSVEEIERFLDTPQNSYWVAEVGGEAAAFFRVQGKEAGNIFIVRSETTVAITGAFTRPQFRGLGLATAILRAVLQAYAVMGYERCSVDFESINPEASAYWLKHFEPVCYSAIRYPESFIKSAP